MKNYQKNSRNLFIAFACMFEQPKVVVYGNLHNWHLNKHIWSLNLNPWFKPTSFNLVYSCISPTHSFCHVMIMHHIVHCIDCVSFSIAGICPLSIDVVSTMSSMTPMKSYNIFRSARQAKTPCSFWYNPTLSLQLSFTALVQQRLNCYMLR